MSSLKKSITETVLWDRLGIGISGICAIHCLALPVLLSLMPFWGLTAFMHDWAHPLFLILLVPAIYFAARRSHYDRKITGLLVAGFILVLIGWLFGHHVFGFLFETIATLSGSALLITGHWLNYRHHQVCDNSLHNHHPVKNN